MKKQKFKIKNKALLKEVRELWARVYAASATGVLHQDTEHFVRTADKAVELFLKRFDE